MFVPAALFSAAANISVNYNTDVNAFNPRKLLGNNTGGWISPSVYNTNAEKIKDAGSTFIRFPGGSMSDEYHWNGSGAYDSDGIWHPSTSAYSKGFSASLTYRGTSSIGYGYPAFLTDGITTAASQWQSDTITAASLTTNAFVIVKLAASQPIDQVKIYWGDTYAVDYDIQYWSSSDYSWAPQQGGTNYWTTIVSVTGNTGGTDVRAISATTAMSFRILMKKSSGTGYKMNEIELYDGGYKKTTNTATTSQTETYASPTRLANKNRNWTPDFGFQEFITLLGNIGSEATGVCTVNFGTGTPEEAAAWVQYAKNNGYLSLIKYWEIGNETEGAWEAGGPVNAEYYAARFIKFSDAMRAVEPSIKICGPVLAALQNNSELYDGLTFMDRFLQVLQTNSKLDAVDALDFHIYANWQNTTEATTLATPNDWTGGSNYKSFIDSLLVKYYGSSSAKEVLMSEHNSGPATLLTMDFMNSLWVVNWLGEYAKSFGGRACANLWDIMNNNASTGSYDHGFLEIGQQTGSYKYQPRSSYWGMYMMNNYFACADEFGNTLVSASSSQPLLPVYAARRNDGRLSLMVVNKDKSNAYTGSITITGYTPDPSAELYTFAATAASPYYIQNYVWHENATASYADPDLPPNESIYHSASGSFAFNFPAYSISVFNFVPLGSTPTITPTLTSTLTGTKTPTFTSTRTMTGTSTCTATETLTYTITGTSTATPVYTATLTATITATCTITATQGTPAPGAGAQENYDKFYVYPSPYRVSGGTGGIWFLNLTKQSTIKIYNIKGDMVYDKKAATPLGNYFLRFEGQRKKDVFAPGIYIYVISNKSGLSTTGKFAVIR